MPATPQSSDFQRRRVDGRSPRMESTSASEDSGLESEGFGAESEGFGAVREACGLESEHSGLKSERSGRQSEDSAPRSKDPGPQSEDHEPRSEDHKPRSEDHEPRSKDSELASVTSTRERMLSEAGCVVSRSIRRNTECRWAPAEVEREDVGRERMSSAPRRGGFQCARKASEPQSKALARVRIASVPKSREVWRARVPLGRWSKAAHPRVRIESVPPRGRSSDVRRRLHSTPKTGFFCCRNEITASARFGTTDAVTSFATALADLGVRRWAAGSRWFTIAPTVPGQLEANMQADV
jgi:hypothetical protein